MESRSGNVQTKKKRGDFELGTEWNVIFYVSRCSPREKWYNLYRYWLVAATRFVLKKIKNK